MHPRLRTALLYGILDLGYVCQENAESVASELLAGGADLLQLRAKGLGEREILELGRLMIPLCRDAGVPFIINDFPAIAIELGADGLHVGQDDGSFSEMRELVGSEMILGRSTHSPEQARQALRDGFDYIGFGPLFPTPTKAGRPGIGMQDVEIVEREVGSWIPVFCIGGIKRGNLSEVVDAGARRAVIVSDLLTADDVAAAVREARDHLNVR